MCIRDRIHRIGGVAQLVVDNIQGVMRFGQVDHSFDKVFAVIAVQPSLSLIHI